MRHRSKSKTVIVDKINYLYNKYYTNYCKDEQMSIIKQFLNYNSISNVYRLLRVSPKLPDRYASNNYKYFYTLEVKQGKVIVSKDDHGYVVYFQHPELDKEYKFNISFASINIENYDDKVIKIFSDMINAYVLELESLFVKRKEEK